MSYNNNYPPTPNTTYQDPTMNQNNQMLPGPPAYGNSYNPDVQNTASQYPTPQPQYTIPSTEYPVPQAQFTQPQTSYPTPQAQITGSQPQYAQPIPQSQVPPNAQIIQLPPGAALPPGAQIVYVQPQSQMPPGVMQPGQLQPGMMQPVQIQPQQNAIGPNGAPVPRATAPTPLMVNQPINMFDPFDVLMKVPKLVVKQSIEWADVLVGYDQANKYKVYIPDANGEVPKCANPIYQAFEENNCCIRQMGPTFPTTIDIFNCATQSKIMTIRKTFGMNDCICCLPEITIEDGAGQLLGTVHSDCQICGDKFTVYDSKGEIIDYIIGPCCQLGKCCTCPCAPFDKIEFNIESTRNSGGVNGQILKLWSGCFKECFTDADTFSIDFPSKSDLNERMLLLGTVFFIDFLFFENNQDNNNNNQNHGW